MHNAAIFARNFASVHPFLKQKRKRKKKEKRNQSNDGGNEVVVKKKKDENVSKVVQNGNMNIITKHELVKSQALETGGVETGINLIEGV